MNSVLANSFTTFFTNLFSNWQLVLFIVLTILLLLAIFFKHFKLVMWIFIIAAIALAIALGVLFLLAAIQWDLFAFIDFAVAWGPTILFSLIVLLSTLINARRGRRKSLILFAQSTGAAILWVVLYYVGAKSQKIDASFVKLVNLFMGENGLQNAVGASAEADTLRKVLAFYLSSLGGSGTIGILLRYSAAYVYTVADMLYHIGFAVICYLFYLLTVLHLYIIYLIFYSEHKYKRKKGEALQENRTDSKYKKHRTAGGFVGLARGILIGVMCLSFLGAGFYMVAGGRGEGKIRDYEASGKYEKPLRIYRSIESYGMQGIFQILNAMSDPNDVPYYLLVADLVFSGSLNDEHNDVSGDVYLTKEFGALSGLARDTIELLLKYGSDEITGAVNGTSNTSLMNNVLSVIKNREFQEEFDLLIAQFDSPKYAYNLGMSLVSAVLANIDSMSFAGSLSEKNRELVKIMFKEGYLSSYIPEDYELYEINERMDAEDPWITSGSNVRPYLGLQQLVTKDDLRVFLNIFLTALTEKGEGADTFNLIRAIMPKIKQLSLFEKGKSNVIDPVLARVYCYVQNAYLRAESDTTGYSYNALVRENVKWTEEIIALLDVADDFFTVYDDVKDAESAVFNRILYVFDAANPNRVKDMALFDQIEARISASKLMGKTLSTSFFRKTLTDGLSQLFDGIYISQDTVYETTFNEDGSVFKYGELHYFLKGLRQLGGMKNQKLFELLFSTNNSDISSILKVLSEAMEQKDSEGRNFAYYATRSELFRSVMSCFLMKDSANVIYVPNASREKNTKGEYIQLIRGNELEGLLNGMHLFSDFVTNCIDAEGGYYDYIDKYFDDPEFMNLLNTNGIIEGSLARLVKERLADGMNDGNIIIPLYLESDVESWCSQAGGTIGELRRFIGAYLLLRNNAKSDEEGEGGEGYVLNLKSLMEGDKIDLLLTTASNLGEKSEQLLSSDIIYYSVSNYLSSYDINNLTIVVPASVCNKLYNDVLERIIKRDELVCVFSKIKLLEVNNGDALDASGQSLLKKLIEGKHLIEGEILSASVVAQMVQSDAFSSALGLRSIYVDANRTLSYADVGEAGYLSRGMFNRNPWSKELPKLLDALALLFADQVDNEDFSLSEATLKAAILHVYQDQEVLDTCLASDIIAARAASLLGGLPDIPGGDPDDPKDDGDDDDPDDPNGDDDDPDDPKGDGDDDDPDNPKGDGDDDGPDDPKGDPDDNDPDDNSDVDPNDNIEE